MADVFVPTVILSRYMARLSGAELKVLMYIWRRTESPDRKLFKLTIRQICDGLVGADGTVLDRGTNLSKNSVTSVIKRFRELGVLPTDGSYKINIPALYGFPEIVYPKHKARPKISMMLRLSVLARDGFACFYCGAKPPLYQMEIDHFVPFSADGQTTYENLRAACAPCNRRKKNKFPEEFAKCR